MVPIIVYDQRTVYLLEKFINTLLIQQSDFQAISIAFEFPFALKCDTHSPLLDVSRAFFSAFDSQIWT